MSTAKGKSIACILTFRISDRVEIRYQKAIHFPPQLSVEDYGEGQIRV